MYTVFWEKGAGSIVVQAVLEEIGTHYDKYYVDMAANEHRSDAYLSKNPTGLIPALQLPDLSVMGESAAIVLHLGEQHPEAELIPDPGNSERPGFLFWLFFMATAGYTTSSRLWHPEQFTRDQKATDPIHQVAEEDTARLFGLLEQNIKGQPYFLTSGFSVLDIYLAMLLEWHPDRDSLFQQSPKLTALYTAVAARPAYQKTMTDHT